MPSCMLLLLPCGQGMCLDMSKHTHDMLLAVEMTLRTLSSHKTILRISCSIHNTRLSSSSNTKYCSCCCCCTSPNKDPAKPWQVVATSCILLSSCLGYDYSTQIMMSNFSAYSNLLCQTPRSVSIPNRREQSQCEPIRRQLCSGVLNNNTSNDCFTMIQPVASECPYYTDT